MSVGRRQAARDLRRDEAQLLHLVARVEAVSPRAALRDDRPVALLPVADRRDRNPQHPSHRTDAVDAATPASFIRHGRAMLTDRGRNAELVNRSLTRICRETSSYPRQNVIRSRWCCARIDETWHERRERDPVGEHRGTRRSHPTADSQRYRLARPRCSDLEPFAVEVQRRDHVTIVQPRGELDLATVETLRSTLDAAIAEPCAPRWTASRSPRAWCSICAACPSSTPPVCTCWWRSTSARSATDSSCRCSPPRLRSTERSRLCGLDQALPFVAPDDAAA